MEELLRELKNSECMIPDPRSGVGLISYIEPDVARKLIEKAYNKGYEDCKRNTEEIIKTNIKI